MLLALTWWVFAALPVAEVPRPGAAVREAAVQVLLSEQDVSVEPGGGQQAFQAARGMLLQQSDRIVVGPGAWVALAILGNQHVVRLDDDLSLQVSELALLNAPKQSQSAVQQLDALLTKQERERTERLIGWHASQTAANTQPVQLLKRDSGGAQKSKAAFPEDFQKEEQASDVPSRRVSVPAAASPRPSPVPSAPPPPPGGPGDIDPELQACIDGAVAAWGAPVKAKLGGSLLVSAKLREGELLLRLPLGLPPPACLAVWFQKRGGLSAHWTNVTVPLP